MAFWDEELAKLRVPCSPINDLAAVLSHPHTRQSDIVLSYDAQNGATASGIAQPVRFGGRNRTATLPPPDLGEHTAAILEALGHSEADIGDLRSRGIVG